MPYFLEYQDAAHREDGDYDFRAISPTTVVKAVKGKRCWICGDPLATNATFILGPMCGITRTSAEPPSHPACARYAAKVCPFLVLPRAKRRDISDLDTFTAGEMIQRNPGVALLWNTPLRRMKIIDDGRGSALFRVGIPHALHFYTEGRAATPAELEHSMRTGLPELYRMCLKDDDPRGSFNDLRKSMHKFGHLVGEHDERYAMAIIRAATVWPEAYAPNLNTEVKAIA